MSDRISYNELLQEAQREPLVVDLPDGSEIIVEFPDGTQVKAVQRAIVTQDIDAAVLALFGDENGKKLIEKFAHDPGDMPGRLVQAIMKKFGIDPNLLV